MNQAMKLDNMSLNQLPKDMVTFEFDLPGGKRASINLAEIMSLGDSYENPHSITLALDQISSFKAFWSALLAGKEEKIDRQKERVAVLESEIKMELPAALVSKGLKATVDGLKDAFQATAMKHSLMKDTSAVTAKEVLEATWTVRIADLCGKYRMKVRRLRTLKEEAAILRVLVDALSSRSFTLSKMADLIDVMLKQGLIQGDEGAFS